MLYLRYVCYIPYLVRMPLILSQVLVSFQLRGCLRRKWSSTNHSPRCLQTGTASRSIQPLQRYIYRSLRRCGLPLASGPRRSRFELRNRSDDDLSTVLYKDPLQSQLRSTAFVAVIIIYTKGPCMFIYATRFNMNPTKLSTERGVVC